VVSVNEALEDEPELINSSPYGNGWICKINPENLEEEKKNLLQVSNLKPFIEAEIIKVKEMMNK
jgi:glycine cleavage system H protein